MPELRHPCDRSGRPPGRTFSQAEADELVRAHLSGLAVAMALIIGGAGALAVIARMFL